MIVKELTNLHYLKNFDLILGIKNKNYCYCNGQRVCLQYNTTLKYYEFKDPWCLEYPPNTDLTFDSNTTLVCGKYENDERSRWVWIEMWRPNDEYEFKKKLKN